jgi:hypothetical protein
MAAKEKVWKLNDKSETGIRVTDNSISIVAGTNGSPNGIMVDETGVYINGKLSITASPDQIRVNGIFIRQDKWADIFPSTVASPTPGLVLNTPVSGVEQMLLGIRWALSNLG